MGVAKEIFDLECETSPAEPFISGYNMLGMRERYGGRLPIQTPEDDRKVLARIDELRARASEEEREYLDSIEAYMRFKEPHDTIGSLGDMLYICLKLPGAGEYVKQYLDHLPAIVDYASRQFDRNDLSLELRFMAKEELDALLSMLKLTRDFKSDDQQPYRELVGQDKLDSVTKVGSKAIKYPDIIKHTSQFTREEVYEKILKARGYPYTPHEMVSIAEREFADDKTTIENLIRELEKAKDAKKSHTIHNVSELFYSAPQDVLVDTSSTRARTILDVLYRRSVERIGEHTLTIELTPEAFRPMLPDAALLTLANWKDPLAYYWITPREGNANRPIVDYLQTDVHEFGAHGIHRMNVANHFNVGPEDYDKLLRVMGFSSAPLAEGFALYMEKDSERVMPEMLTQLRSSEDERVRKMFDVDVETLMLEYRTQRLKWKMFRDIRTVVDVEVNMGWSTAEEVLTGFCEELGYDPNNRSQFEAMYNKVLAPFKSRRGYAPGYLFGYLALDKLAEKADTEGVPRKAFNTKVTTLGFPSLSRWERELDEWIEGQPLAVT